MRSSRTSNGVFAALAVPSRLLIVIGFALALVAGMGFVPTATAAPSVPAAVSMTVEEPPCTNLQLSPEPGVNCDEVLFAAPQCNKAAVGQPCSYRGWPATEYSPGPAEDWYEFPGDARADWAPGQGV